MTLTLIAALALSQASSTAPVEVPFRLADNAIIVDAVVNGKEVSLMLDTGFAGWATIGSDTYLGKPTGKMTLRDFVGEMQVDTVKLTSVKLGGRKMKLDSDAEAVVDETNDYSSAYNMHCDGIMGFSLIKDNITEINFEKRVLVLYPDTFDVTKRPVDNKKTFINKLLPLGQASLEMLVQTDGGGAMTMALDTGNAFYSTTHKDVLERLGLWKNGAKPKYMTTSWVASGPVDTFYTRMPKLSIFGVPVESSIWSIIDLPASSADGDGTVGMGFLQNFNVLIDYNRRRVWLQNWNGRVTPDEEGNVGISAAFSPKLKRTIIYKVAEGSPAEKAGLLMRDYLIAIDGKEVLNIGPQRLDRMMTGPVGTEVTISYSRDGALKHVKLKREALVNVAGS